MAAEFGQPDEVECVCNGMFRFAAIGACEVEWKTNVRVHARPRHQRRRLEHEAQLPARDAGGGKGSVPPCNPPTRRCNKPRDEIQDGRLAAAGWAEQRDEFAIAHVKIDGQKRLRAIRKPLRHAAQRDGRRDDIVQGRTFTSFTRSSVHAFE